MLATHLIKTIAFYVIDNHPAYNKIKKNTECKTTDLATLKRY
jgi:hypothetical protein